MLAYVRALRRQALVAACALSSTIGHAQTPLLNEVHTVSATDRAVPVEHSFSISLAGSYTITLTDLGAALTPAAPLASVKLAITNGSTIVGTPLTAAGATQFNATAGTYLIHVIGAPGSGAGSGPIGIQVTGVGGTFIASFSDTLALPPGSLPSGEATLDDSFTVTSGGSYQVSLSDLQLPQSLGVVTLLLTQAGAATPLAILPDVTNNNALQATVSLQPGVTYRIFAVGQTDTGISGGLYSASVVPTAGGAPAYARTIPVGTVTLVDSPYLTAGSYSFIAADLTFPAALSQFSAVAVVNGQLATRLTATGTQMFTATSNTYQVFALATPAAGSSGSYSVIVKQQSGAAALNVARAISAPGGPVSGYSFDASLDTAGTYAFDVADFAIPTQLSSINAAVAQNGILLGKQGTAGAADVNAAAGPLTVLVFAQPGTTGGLFGVDLTASGSSTQAFATTQGVGQLFAARQISVTSAGSYTVDVTDVGFPAALASLAVLVTQGSHSVGSIFVGGKFAFQATPGNYFINFIAQPGGDDEAGTYALDVAATPPAPAVTLTGSAPSVPSGTPAKLTWTTQNATSCTASGGWSGAQALSGTATTEALTSATTFTLTCTGPGGSAAQSVTVTITQSSGGGGTLGCDSIAILIALLLLHCAVQQWRKRHFLVRG